MSEKIYAWMLRFYPAHFRQSYGADAMQLFRDRSRDETGFFSKLRLWLDLLADFAVSVPGQYQHAQQTILGASARQHLDNTPSFQTLEGDLPRPAALLSGTLLMLAAVAASPMLIALGSYSPRFLWFSQPQYHFQAAADPSLNAADRHRVIAGAIANLQKYYNFPDVAQKTADALLAHEKRGDDDAVKDGADFADLLTREMLEVSHDHQLKVIYFQVRPPDLPPAPRPDRLTRYRAAMRNNCSFEKVETLPHKIGYLKFNAFPEVSLCGPTAAAAIASLNDSDAIIFDLRDNTGGYMDMVALMAGYLFDHRIHLNDRYNRAENATLESWTPPPVPGNRLANKPAYVLTSAVTFSGGEEFSYDLKMLRRATIVGEATFGRGHVPRARRIDDHFDIRVPDDRSINPISKTDWDGPGVLPDVKVRAADALETAVKLATSRLGKN
jgi:hypothetical protein